MTADRLRQHLYALALGLGVGTVVGACILGIAWMIPS